MDAGSFCCNIIWLIFIGWELFLGWCFFGLFYCITIIGIPLGLQAFKIALFVIWPFGKEIIYPKLSMTNCQVIGNIIWIILGGLEIALVELIIGVICCITIIGIPFGLQLFKLAKIALIPFGAEVVESTSEIPKMQPFNPSGTISTSYS